MWTLVPISHWTVPVVFIIVLLFEANQPLKEGDVMSLCMPHVYHLRSCESAWLSLVWVIELAWATNMLAHTRVVCAWSGSYLMCTVRGTTGHVVKFDSNVVAKAIMLCMYHAGCAQYTCLHKMKENRPIILMFLTPCACICMHIHIKSLLCSVYHFAYGIVCICLTC